CCFGTVYGLDSW
nr:immunoglobulin heavy chain junction region [Macaca mulatta]MOY23270.1 immunoglobulin heavy chain junction region [Macaca mulatta]MOY26435.1 immunoglobulin heavy chain junction region [Macaca mulatta]MOY26768.1 immunoglobulin heavy chain junction region [Macaca mulatta]MOY27275.1 immunoglobulin heavy chain junction region [Macaca mulatta]